MFSNMFDRSLRILRIAFCTLRTHQTILIHNSLTLVFEFVVFSCAKTKSYREAKFQNRMLLWKQIQMRFCSSQAPVLLYDHSEKLTSSATIEWYWKRFVSLTSCNYFCKWDYKSSILHIIFFSRTNFFFVHIIHQKWHILFP